MSSAREQSLKRAEIVSGRQVEFEALSQNVFESLKEETTRQIQLKPSVKYHAIYNILLQHFGPESVSYLDVDRKSHGIDISLQHLAAPDLVIFPQRIEQIQWLVTFASQNKIPLIPYGKGSSLQSNITALNGGISIDMSRMNHVLDYHPEDHEIRVQAGVTKNSISDYLKESNLFLPIDIECNASIGGLVATNAAGSGSLFYGSMKSNVLGLKVVMPDGSIIITGKRARRHTTGYDLNSLFTGSEGTLGIIVEITLRLQPVPKAITAACATFDKLEDALNSARKIICQGTILQRCELLDKQTIQALNKFHSTDFPEFHCLFLEAHGNSRQAVDFVIEECKDVCREVGVLEYSQFSEEENDRSMLWKARSTAWTAIARSGLNTELAVLDVAVPLSLLTQNILSAQRDLELLNVQFAPIMANIGDGSFFILIPVQYHDKAAVQCIESLCARITNRAIECDGTCSASQGIGAIKREFLESEFGRESIKVMHSIKKTFDPHNIMNPGKIFMNFD